MSFSFARVFHAPALLGCLSSGLLLSSLHAQSSAPPEVLTLQAALQRAVEQSPILSVTRYDERAAEALIEQAGLKPNPTLDVSVENVLGTGATRDFDRLEGTVQASQALERGGKRARRLELAQRQHGLVTSQSAAHRSDVLTATALAYIEVMVAERALLLTNEPLRIAQETVDAVNQRVRAGMSSPADLARSRSAQASTQADANRARSRVRAARAALAATWGGSEIPENPFPTALILPAELPEPSTLLTGLSAHPRLSQQQAVIETRRASLKLEQANASQDISVGGGLRFFREGTDTALLASISVPLPTRNKNQGNIRAAREVLTGAEESVRVIEADLRTSFYAAWHDLRTAHASVLTLKADALPPAEEALSIVRRAYQDGQLPLLDVLDAQRALVALQQEIIDQEAAYARAQVRLDAIIDLSFSGTAQLISTP